MSEEDPTFRVKDDPETGQTIISGMGELHLEVIVDRMKREYGALARAGKPQVVYRETVLGEGQGRAVFERDMKEQQIYGEASAAVKARTRGTGMDFKRALPASAALLPENIIAAAMQESARRRVERPGRLSARGCRGHARRARAARRRARRDRRARGGLGGVPARGRGGATVAARADHGGRGRRR